MCKTNKNFMNRVLAFLRSTPYTGKISISEELILDISWFIEFAQKFNGLVLLNDKKVKTWHIECDACLVGGGGFSENNYIAEKFSEDFLNLKLDICQIEAINVICALDCLTPKNLNEYLIIINTDNKTAQTVLDTGHGRDKVLTACARYIWQYSSLNNCVINVVHKPGSQLIIADALSRAFKDSASQKIAMSYCLNNNLFRTRCSFLDTFNKLL